jgi:hypothetical protein
MSGHSESEADFGKQFSAELIEGFESSSDGFPADPSDLSSTSPQWCNDYVMPLAEVQEHFASIRRKKKAAALQTIVAKRQSVGPPRAAGRIRPTRTRRRGAGRPAHRSCRPSAASGDSGSADPGGHQDPLVRASQEVLLEHLDRHPCNPVVLLPMGTTANTLSTVVCGQCGWPLLDARNSVLVPFLPGDLA